MSELAWGLTPAGPGEMAGASARRAPSQQTARPGEHEAPRQEDGRQAKPDRTFVFRGRVQDCEGHPVAAAAIYLSAPNIVRVGEVAPPSYRPNHFQARFPVETRPGKEPIRLDLAVKQGACITGRLIDRTTGRPLDGIVTYFPFADNANDRRLNATERKRRDTYSSSPIHDDGRFSALAHTLPPEVGVDDLLGLDFLRGQILTLDFQAGQISLS